MLDDRHWAVIGENDVEPLALFRLCRVIRFALL